MVGDISSDEPVLEIEVYQNLNLQASFTPTLKPEAVQVIPFAR